MRKYKLIIFYVLLIGVLLSFIFWLLGAGKNLESVDVINTVNKNNANSFFSQFLDSVLNNIRPINAKTGTHSNSLAILLLQIITIVFTARTFGFLFNKIGQPTVIGEILAGIFLGPSILGHWFPAYSDFLFPIASLDNLKFLSQVGLVLFMFVIGMELDLKVLKTKARDAVVISHASIIIPFSLGMVLSYFLYNEFAPVGVNFTSFSLFMGSAMSITAFPVLARILQERDLTKTRLGTLVITCAATDDITAWCILACVIAIVKAGSIFSALFTIAMAIIFVIVIIKIVQPFLKRLGEVYSNKESLSLNIVAVFFSTLLISAFAAEVIGIHALFGAFLAGVIMPPSVSFKRIIIEKVESVSLVLFLPLFFVITGLRTEIGLLYSWHLWLVCIAIICVAVIGKFGGGLFTAKIVGQSWKNSFSIGALMNTRGLMELVVLNIGYELKVLTPQIYAMMVLMAVFTTFMTGPSLDFINKIFKKDVFGSSDVLNQKFRILLSFANPISGKKLMRIASLITLNAKETTEITVLHVTPTADINTYQLAEYEKESFKPVKFEANKLGLPIKTNYKVSNDVNEEILSVANAGTHDLMLVGIGQSVFAGSLLGQFIGMTARTLNPDKLIGAITGKNPIFQSKKILDQKSNEFINGSKIPVGVFIDHDLDQVNKIIIAIISISDVFLLFYLKKIIKNSAAHITILDYAGIIEINVEIRDEINNIESYKPKKFNLIEKGNFTKAEFSDYDLVVVSIEGYNKFTEENIFPADKMSSLLLLRP